MKKRRYWFDSDTLVLLKQIGIGVIVISLVSLLLAGIWYGTRISALTVDTIRIEGGETIQHSKVRELVDKSLDGNYLGLVPRRFVWFLPKEDIISTVQEIDRLHNVTLLKIGGSEIVITFDEYIPKALWCESIDSSKCLFVDETGFAFGQAPNLLGGSFLRFITSGREMKVGQLITDKQSFSTMFILTGLLADKEWYVSHVELDQVGDVFLEISGGGELKVTASEPPEKIVENFLTILSSDEFSHIKPGNFQYIDLRFGNKVFINEEPAVPIEDTTGEEVGTSTIEVD